MNLNNKNRIYTPPVTKPKNNVFFNSDDSLYKTETRKLTIPRIEIEPSEPIFRVEITDFSEPNPTNVTLRGEIETTTTTTTPSVYDNNKTTAKSLKNKTNYVQQKSFSLDIKDVPYIDSSPILTEQDHYLNTKYKPISISLQDLSSSTSSLNSCVHESNLDLSQDTPIKEKNWKSPNELREIKILSKRFEDIFGNRIVLSATSYPNLNNNPSKRGVALKKNKSLEEIKSFRAVDDRGDSNKSKLTETERYEVLKVLEDWSLNGSQAKGEFQLSKVNYESKRKTFSEAYAKYFKTNIERHKYNSEPNLSIDTNTNNGGPIVLLNKYKSDTNLTMDPNNFYHDCKFRNCIFNNRNLTKDGTKRFFINETFNQEVDETINESQNLDEEPLQQNNFNKLKRCGSLERLNNDINNYKKKFPDSYVIVRKITTTTPIINNRTISMRKCIGKSWKSCSDIKRQKVVQKCCKNAKKTCPILKSDPNCCTVEERKTQSCDNFDDSLMTMTNGKDLLLIGDRKI